MFSTITFAHHAEDTKVKANPISLLCWDIAHPMLPKLNQIARDTAQIEQLRTTHDWQLDLNFRALLESNHTLVFTNLDREIIWVSSDFFEMTGYTFAEVEGRKPVFLQGEKTSEKAKQLIRERLNRFEVVKSKLINYRKNGETYGCNIMIQPILNSDGKVMHFVAIEKEVE